MDRTALYSNFQNKPVAAGEAPVIIAVKEPQRRVKQFYC
jgi:hypothetical protein